MLHLLASLPFPPFRSWKPSPGLTRHLEVTAVSSSPPVTHPCSGAPPWLQPLVTILLSWAGWGPAGTKSSSMTSKFADSSLAIAGPPHGPHILSAITSHHHQCLAAFFSTVFPPWRPASTWPCSPFSKLPSSQISSFYSVLGNLTLCNWRPETLAVYLSQALWCGCFQGTSLTVTPSPGEAASSSNSPWSQPLVPLQMLPTHDPPVTRAPKTLLPTGTPTALSSSAPPLPDCGLLYRYFRLAKAQPWPYFKPLFQKPQRLPTGHQFQGRSFHLWNWF